MPCILPEVLLPWLIERNLFWNIQENEICRYWQHLRHAGSPVAEVCPTNDAIPIWLWGDSAQYNAKKESVIVLCCGCVLDERKSSVSTCFPFVIVREETCQNISKHDFLHVQLDLYMKKGENNPRPT